MAGQCKTIGNHLCLPSSFMTTEILACNIQDTFLCPSYWAEVKTKVVEFIHTNKSLCIYQILQNLAFRVEYIKHLNFVLKGFNLLTINEN